MTLSKEQIDRLIRLIQLTRDEEITCDQCLTLIAEFAEQQLMGRSVHEGLEAVGHHLELCQECREEYEALRRALRDLDE